MNISIHPDDLHDMFYDLLKSNIKISKDEFESKYWNKILPNLNRYKYSFNSSNSFSSFNQSKCSKCGLQTSTRSSGECYSCDPM
jgi:hypothetical protein